MRERRDEFILRPIGLFKFQGTFLYTFFQQRSLFTQEFFSFPPAGHVTRNFRKATEFSFVVMQSGDYNVPPESRSIFTNAPAFIFDSSFDGSLFKLALGFL